LAIDAATPVSGWREDLLARAHASVPETWEQLLTLAKRGLVAVPALAIDSLMNLYMLCVALGDEPFLRAGQFVDAETGAEALRLLRRLVTSCDPACLARNPIATWEELANGDTIAYCPFAYGYSNYARRGYAQHAIRVGGLVSLGGSEGLRSTLGGAGLAISSHCAQPEKAAAYAQFTASGACQSGIYFDAGGQPGHRAAWRDEEVNRRSNQFFSSTLATLDAAWVRPRFPGYLEFQDTAAPLLHCYLADGGAEREVIRALNELLLRCAPSAREVRP
jgi:multiple sugar transport system substrate-binding protein